MAEDHERIIIVKNLECTKLRQVIEDFKSKQALLINENANLKRSVEEGKTLLEISIQDLNRQLSQKRQENVSYCETLRQLQDSYQKLTEELQEAKKSKEGADKETVTANEKNYHLTFDLSNLREDNRTLEAKVAGISSELSEEKQIFQKTTQELYQSLQQNDSLYGEVKELTGQVKEMNVQIQKKETKIAHLAIQLEEFQSSLQKRYLLEKEVAKLRKQNADMQLEIRESSQSGDRLTDTLLKNRALLTENKKLRHENEALLKELSALQEQENRSKDKFDNLSLELQTTQQELFGLRTSNEQLLHENQKANKVLEETNECFKQKNCLEEKNRSLAIKCKAHAAEMNRLNQSLLSLLKECSNLKYKIEDLERSNVQKLNIIAKLKGTEKKATATDK